MSCTCAIAHKLQGSYMGLWLLVPEYLLLGAWDLLQGVFADALILFRPNWLCRWVNESALCVNRIRVRGSLRHEQGIKVKNLQQLRQTRLTIWVKQHGLRKAQYVAGFKSISGIERYNTQHLEDLQKIIIC